VSGMNQYMNADESGEEFPLMCFHSQGIALPSLDATILSKFDDMIRGNWKGCPDPELWCLLWVDLLSPSAAR
jgi:hypothetical protein